MLQHYLRRAASLPPRQLVLKSAGFIARHARARRGRWLDLNRTTYGRLESVQLGSYFPGDLPLDRDAARLESVRGVAEQFLAHRFDVLGSGWLNIRHGMRCAGLEGIRFDADPGANPDVGGGWLASEVSRANVAESVRVWRMLDAGYVAIDWQRDIKSGYRWSAQDWGGSIRYGSVRGADVKVPWELSRLQHLPQLAVAHAHAAAGAVAFREPRVYAREFRNQVLDFVASNPPRYGVNWTSTMDVAIRVANVLVAHDMFVRAGARFDVEFERVLARSVVEHAEHIVRFLEWNDDLRGNHYLANLAGLLFAAAYLPASRRTDGWLAFATRELLTEAELQFNPDGSNFEGSTAYHRLSAEMMAYAVALVSVLPQERIGAITSGRFARPAVSGPDAATPVKLHHDAVGRRTALPMWIGPMLGRMAEFARDVTKPSRRIVLFGDNDSGRFIKLHPIFRKMRRADAVGLYRNLDGADLRTGSDTYWDEDHQDPAQLIGAIAGLLGRDDLASSSSGGAYEAEIFARFGASMHATLNQARALLEIQGVRADAHSGIERPFADELPYSRTWRAWTEAPAFGAVSLRADMETIAYPDFGLYIARSARVFLAIRCGPVGQNGYGGHTHNDQLAVELVVDGEEVLTDPGTYLYTAIPERRNEYRSAAAHNAPWPVAMEPARLGDGLFRLGDARAGRCVHWRNAKFAGEFNAVDVTVRRVVEVHDHDVTITDSTSVPQRAALGAGEAPSYAPGYGVVLR